MPTSSLQNIAISHRISVKTRISGGRTGSSAPTTWNHNFTYSPENHHKTGVFLRVDVGIDPYGAKQKIVAFCEVFCRGGRPCPPSKSGVFPWSFVGADAHIGPSKSGDFLRSFVGADAHIGPLKCCEFASDFRKTRQFRRADRVVRPYGAKTKPNAITSDRPRAGAFPFGRWDGSMWASTPTERNRNPVQ